VAYRAYLTFWDERLVVGMDVAKRMQSLRDQFPECTLMAFADLEAGMVLSVSADTSRMQEEISSLCSTAKTVLSHQANGPIEALISNGSDAGVFEAVLIEPEEVGVFLKSTIKQSDVFCCVCTSRISLQRFLPAVRAALDALEMPK